jgi:hypothetical protein
LKDVHQKARDRAQQRVASPPLSDIHNTPGSPQVNGNMTFASERERAKEALRTELNTFNCVLQYVSSGRIAVTRDTAEHVNEYLEKINKG